MNSDELELFAGEPTPGADELMEDFVQASARSGSSPRELYLMRETMHSLLRLAQSEQMLEIRRSVDKLLPASLRPACKRRRMPRDPSPGQTQFVFGRDA
ncbi:MAG: hypothetical protein RL404_941 [Pseudomonadota bacterium]|jgi:hypothetical protein